MDNVLKIRIEEVAKKKILFLPHTIQQMSRPERMITTREVKNVIFEGEIIENYPDDLRGHSCLLLGYGINNRPIHVVCSPKLDYLAIITAYLPNSNEWSEDFKRRI
ncbi:DUF4258 domain-containing protein [Geminocystis sp.]|uniref:DUF4258 domain-containing protein n=1 Tax=Geminocystis sp. TaxID=2664100 RepID=UPI003593B571